MIHSLSKTLAVAALAIMMSAAGNIAAASDGNKSSASDGREYVRTPNYALAERFSAKRIGQMVFSTEVRPEWFKDGKKFLYSWKTSEGTQYYCVPSEVFQLYRNLFPSLNHSGRTSVLNTIWPILLSENLYARA